MAHARLGPSNHRWPHCPGSVREEEQYPDVSGDAAIDGAGTHLLLETCVLDEVSPASLVGTIIGANHPEKPGGWLVDAARAERVQACLSYLDRRFDELRVEYPTALIALETESKTDPGGMFGRKDWWGTCDLTITVTRMGVAKYIEVIDYKDGRGWVAAEDNTQLVSYMGGKLRPFIASGPEKVRPFNPVGIDGIRMTIVQPKTNPPIRYWEPDVSTLITHLEKLGWAAHLTDDPDAPLVSGKHCQWCKHKPNCSEQSKQDLQVVKIMTNDVAVQDRKLFEVIEETFGDVSVLDSEKLSDLADAKDGILAIFEKVEAEIQRRLEAGLQVPGFTMAPGRGRNIWAVPEEDVVKALKARKWKLDDIYPPSLVSPAQVLKSSKLTSDQKARLEKDYISFVAGDLKLKKVARQEKTFDEKVAIFQDVAVQSVKQTTTDFF